MMSKIIKSAGYNESQRVLTIEFHNGEHYTYLNISPETYDAFQEAESKEKFFNEHIRNELVEQEVKDLRNWFQETASNTDSVTDDDNQIEDSNEKTHHISPSNKQGLSFLDTNNDESVSTMVKTYDLRAKNGQLLFTVFATLRGWNAGSIVDGEIKNNDGIEILTIDFSFNKEKMFEHIPVTIDVVGYFINQFNDNNANPLGKLLTLNLKELAEEINAFEGMAILFHLSKWMLTDTTENGKLDMEKIHQYDPKANQMNLVGFARAYSQTFAGKRNEADSETIMWCDLNR